ncbi:MFS transporter [Parafrankia sp. EUN1f]|uniref:MFS transporter n=1 Tax=Parafrankia sp. EUN1f TaxID=102897 RepID=UPI0001C43DF6|nr:MFS transporter [Parafrankia sp. EUN1f]EFC85764.1 major facilitator superfamily MFS_1 [Parafrankia sp. EUN1f]
MPPKPTDHRAQPAIPRKWLALAFVVTAQLMVVLDATIVNVAMPAAQVDLHFADHDRQWIITAYALAFGSLLLLGGRLVDLFGQKHAFIVGLAGFALASALGGFASSFGLLVTARAGQGAFGALLAPATLSLISTAFTDSRERAKAFGVFGAVAASGGAIGLFMGGVLTEYLSWRWCLFVNLVFALPVLAGTAVLLPRTARSARPRIDVPGVITVTSGLVAIVYGFARAESRGWNDTITVGSLFAGVALVALFVFVERRSQHPLLPLHVILDRDRGGSMLALGLLSFGLFGLFLFLTYYLQTTLGFSALATGLAFVPFPLSIIVGANLISGPLLPRYGPRVLIVIGAVVAAAGMLILQALAVDGSYLAVVMPALVVTGVGVGLVFTASVSTGTLGVDPSDAGVVSAMVNMAQQVGGSIGTALLSSVYGSAVQQRLRDGSGASGDPDAAAVHGYHVTFAVSATCLLVVALAGLIVRRVRDRVTPTAEHSEVLVTAH